jgi:hypothetical protein
MVFEENMSPDPAFALIISERASNMKAGKKRKRHSRQIDAYGIGYKRAELINDSTGKVEEIVLFDINDEHNEDLLACRPRLELRADLKAALDTFTLIEKRILFRVLVQGQSLRTATKRMRKSSRTWERWYSEEALPRLRKLLEDYQEDGKVVLQ